MKKQLFSILAVACAIFMVSPVIASEDGWSVREVIDSKDITYLFGERVTWANGRVNANFNGETGSGYVYASVRLADGSSDRISVNWASHGRSYGMTVLADNPFVTVLLTNARVIYGGDISYGNQVYVVYYKASNQLVVIGQGFQIGSFPFYLNSVPMQFQESNPAHFTR